MKQKRGYKSFLAVLMAVIMVFAMVTASPVDMAKAAADNPKLNHVGYSVLEGQQVDLNVINKIEGSSYKWITGDEKIATVTNKGIVTGIKKGKATITCKIKTPLKKFNATCKITVIKAAKTITISNKTTSLYVGDTYDLNRELLPSDSNDKTIWESNDSTIAKPDLMGKITALKEGRVTIVASTLSGAMDSVTITVKKKNPDPTVAPVATVTPTAAPVTVPASPAIPAVTTAPTPTPIMETTSIKSIKYDFTITGVSAETNLHFEAVRSDSNDKPSKDLLVSSNGDYSITLDCKNATGMQNMGYFTTIAGSSIKATLNKITVNDTYEYNGNAVLDISSDWANGLKNIWGGMGAGTKIYENANSYLQLNSDKSAFVLYTISTPVPTDVPVLTETNITSIQYDFTISGVSAETTLKFAAQSSAKEDSDDSEELIVKENGDYSVTLEFTNATGMINMGFFDTIAGSSIRASLTKITVNGTYAYDCGTVLDISSTWANGLKNIWGGMAPGTRIYENDNSCLQMNSDKSAFVFYLITAPTSTPTPTPTDAPKSVATNIASIKYDFSITGVSAETTLQFKAGTADKGEVTKDLVVSSDKDYSITLDCANTIGMQNMGFFNTIKDSTIKAKLTKITVNDTYVYDCNTVLDVSSTWANSLKNIWGGMDAGTKIYEGTNSYIMLNNDKSAFVFYVAEAPTSTPTPTEAPKSVATNIASIKYDFSITGVSAETTLQFKAGTADKGEVTKDLVVSSDKDYSITLDCANTIGMQNMGFFNTIKDSTIKAKLTKITVNDTYVYDCNTVLDVSSTWANSLKNIWGGMDAGTKIYEGTNSYIQLNNDKSAFVFYVTTTPAPTPTEAPKSVATNIASIKYDFSITGVSAETTLNFKAQTANGEVVKDLVVSSDKDYSITLDCANTIGIQNMGFFNTIKDSTIKAKLTKITVNDTYVYDCNTVLDLSSTWANSLKNIWGGMDAGTKIYEGINSYIMLNNDKSAFVFYCN